MLRSEEKLQSQNSLKLVFSYVILVVGTMANLALWTDSRPSPVWLSLLTAIESLALLNIWLGRLIAKTFWEKSVRISYRIVLALLLLRLVMVPFAVG
jgi:hypothetical protein